MANVLNPGDALGPGEALVSPNGACTLSMQSDGNLCVYADNVPGALWARGDATAGTRAVMQTDGNFVMYRPDDSVAFAVNPGLGHEGSSLSMQNDGNVVIYEADGSVLWSTSTTVRIRIAIVRGGKPTAGNGKFPFKNQSPFKAAIADNSLTIEFDPGGNAGVDLIGDNNTTVDVENWVDLSGGPFTQLGQVTLSTSSGSNPDGDALPARPYVLTSDLQIEQGRQESKSE